MPHFYFAFEITTALTTPQKNAVDAALISLGDQVNSLPHLRIRVRDRLDKQAFIVEISVPGSVTKAQAVNAVATALGISVATLNANSNFVLFGTVNDTQGSRDACETYLNAARVQWEAPGP